MSLSPYEELAIEILVRLLRDGVEVDAAMRRLVYEAARSLVMERNNGGPVERKAS